MQYNDLSYWNYDEIMKFESGFYILYPWIPIEYNKGNAQFQ